MRSPTSTRGWPVWAVGLVLLAGLLLVGLPAFGQAIKVTSAVPDTTEQGVVGLVVAIAGDNFASGAKVNFYVTGTKNPGGIAVKSVKFKDAKNLEATIDVAADAQTELKFDIEVRCNGRTGKGTELFKVSVKTTGGDLTPPGTIIDLTVLEGQIGFNTAVLTWTAPANDGFDPASGPAAKYDIRVRKASPECGPYTMEIWVDDTMTGIWSDPCHVYYSRPSAGMPGTAETATAFFLSPNTSYWATLRTVDASPQGPNWSTLADGSHQLYFTTGSFPPAGWTAPWAAQVVDACPVLGTTCHMHAPPRLSFDRYGNPMMLYLKRYVPTLASWTGSGWVAEPLTLAIDTGNFNYDFAVDPWSGEATIVSIVPGTRPELRFYRRNGSIWSTETLATGSLAGATLGYGPESPVATVAYFWAKGSNSHLQVSQLHGASWSTESAASAPTGALARSLAFDSDDNPAVTFSQDLNGANRLAFALRSGGTWTVEQVAPAREAPWGSLSESSVAFDPKRGDFVAAARYYDGSTSTSQLRFCQRSAGDWSCETVAQGDHISGVQLALDGSGTVFLVYREHTNFLMLTRPAGASGWAAEYIDWNVWESPPGDLVIGPDGRPSIAYPSANDWTGAGGSDFNRAVSIARRLVPAP